MVKYNVKYRPQKADLIGGILIFIVSLGVSLFSSHFTIKSQSTIGYTSVLSHKSEIDYDDGYCSGVYYYKGPDDNEYKCKTFMSGATSCPEQTKVYYKSNNISKCKTQVDKKAGKIYIPFMVFGLLMFFLATFGNIYSIIKYKNILNKGTVIKNIPCTIETLPEQKNNNGQEYKIIKATYSFNGGVTKEFSSERMILNEEINTCDLLIDLNDLGNYYLQPVIEEVKEGQSYQGEMANLGSNNNDHDSEDYVPPMDINYAAPYGENQFNS